MTTEKQPLIISREPTENGIESISFNRNPDPNDPDDIALLEKEFPYAYRHLLRILNPTPEDRKESLRIMRRLRKRRILHYAHYAYFAYITAFLAYTGYVIIFGNNIRTIAITVWFMLLLYVFMYFLEIFDSQHKRN